MKLLIDMNLSPEWQQFLHEHGFEAVHWSTIGAGNALDAEIMKWARDNQFVVFTHDLDFGILLAHSQNGSPSVIQVRTQDVSPAHLGLIILSALRVHGEALKRGALVTVDEFKSSRDRRFGQSFATQPCRDESVGRALPGSQRIPVGSLECPPSVYDFPGADPPGSRQGDVPARSRTR